MTAVPPLIEAIVSWEQESAEERFERELPEEESPDKMFERRWALTILDQAAARLRADYAAAGRASVFEILKAHVTGAAFEDSYAEQDFWVCPTRRSARYAARRCPVTHRKVFVRTARSPRR